tara:strand:+ start:3210 stop:6635 length:3426 start_codon:yes stop_codon:yes gene_type:complete
MKNNPFIHLRTQSSYSLSESAIKIDKLIDLTKSENMPAVALTDNNNMFGVLEFSIKCIQNGIQPIIGTSINILSLNQSNNKFINQATFIAKNEKGYHNLIKLSSKSHLNNINDFPGLELKDIYEYKDGLIIFFGGINNPFLNYFKNNKLNQIKELINSLKNEFNEDLLFELQRIDNFDLDSFEENYINIALENNIPLIATNNAKYPNPDYFEAHDSLVCIAEKSTINHENRYRSNQNTFFKSSHSMKKLFQDIPECIENTFLVSLKCNYAPLEKKPKLPKFETTNNISEEQELINNARNGLEKRFLENIYTNDEQKIYKKRLEYEMHIINSMGFSGYFLIVSDFIKWAKNNEIPVGPGRGSGAGSVVAWSLFITNLDPIKYGLIFERFLNPERISLPDFDIDFCQDRRDEVIDYVTQKYGKSFVAHIITFGTLASRLVIRDLGRVHEIPYNEVDKFSKMIPYNAANPISLKKSIDLDDNLRSTIKNDERINRIFNLGVKLEGLYRHASTHAAGVVISDQNLLSSIPLFKDPKTKKITTQFSMKYVELSGLIKFDFLGLTTLTIIDKTRKLIEKSLPNFQLDHIPLDDKKTFKMLSLGKTTGVFQLESGGMKESLKRLKPDKFEEIIAVVALFRPGPMENIPSFCNRKHNLEKIDYFHPLLKPVLEETYGIIVYQEQVMQIAQILSGYSLGEADILRKAMGKKIPKEMKAQKNKFVEGATKKGLDVAQASYIFDLVEKFAGYGFNKSHAAGYGLIAYQTGYLKTHFKEEFLVSSMNMSINKTENIVMFKKEINDLDIKFLKPDINYSQTEFSIELNKDNNKCIRFGLAAIKGVGFNAMKNLILEREKNGQFKDIIDFISRLNTDVVNKKQLEKLIQSGSFDSIDQNRCFLFNNVTNLINIHNTLSQNKDQNSLFKDQDNKIDYINNLKKFSDWSMLIKLKNELDVIGFYFSEHPLSLYSKEIYDLFEITSYEKILSNNRMTKSRVVGSILDIKDRTSKDGNKYAFITLSDKNNQYELTIFGDTLLYNSDLIYEGSLVIFDIDIFNNENGKRMIIKKVHSLEKEINSKSFNHTLTLTEEKQIDIIKNLLTNRTPNMNSISINLISNKSKINISLSKDLTYINEFEFNKVLKSNNILRKITINN